MQSEGISSIHNWTKTNKVYCRLNNEHFIYESEFIGFLISEIIKIEEQYKIIDKDLISKINWMKGEEELCRQLEILKTNGFIHFESIPDVLSGKEIAEFIKHKKYKSLIQNILSLFKFWDDEHYINNFVVKVDRNGKDVVEWKCGQFITSHNSFKQDNKLFNYDSLKAKKERMTNRDRMDDKVILLFKKILIP
jgi:hypothetical protein